MTNKQQKEWEEEFDEKHAAWVAASINYREVNGWDKVLSYGEEHEWIKSYISQNFIHKKELEEMLPDRKKNT